MTRASRFRLAPWMAAGLLAACGPPGEEPTRQGAGAAERTRAAAPPHRHQWARPRTVVLVMIDTLRADVLAAYAGREGLTPGLDDFARESFVFTQAYATSSWTRSSVASMLSGRYATSHAVLDKEDVVPEAVLMLPELLEASGPTWSFGITTNGNTSGKIGFAQGYDVYGPHREAERRRYPGDRIGLVPGPAVTQRALELLVDPRAEDADTTFAFVQYIDPHDPYFANPDLMDTPEPPGEFSGSRLDIDALVAAGEAALTEVNRARLRWLYDSEVRYVDRAFAQLIDGLKVQGLYEQAMIVVVADHGEAFWEHGLRGHGKTLYEEEIRVPLMIRLPGMQADQARAIGRPVSLVDLAPTIVDALGLPRPGVYEGRSLLPLIDGLARDERLDYVFAELALFENKNSTMLRFGKLKLQATYWRKRGRNRTELELFDLASDPLEQDNRIDDPAYQVRRTALMAELSAWESDVARWAVENESVDMEDLDEELLEELKGLGYIQD